jgi:hypothetical protein
MNLNAEELLRLAKNRRMTPRSLGLCDQACWDDDRDREFRCQRITGHKGPHLALPSAP